MKISLGMIARDSAETIVECLDSVLPYVDEAVIGFGGRSSDGTEDLVERTLADWGQEHLNFTWRVLPMEWEDDFSLARNQVWDDLTGDIALWLDSDDILVNGERLRAHIEAQPDATCFTMPYTYDEDEFGNTTCTLVRERLVRPPKAWDWIGAVHEILSLDEVSTGVPFIASYIEDVIVRHNPKRRREHKQTRNLDILYRELARSEPDPSQRLLFYLGRENATRGNFKEAFQHLNRYISRATQNSEAYQVALMIANIQRAQGQTTEAKRSALRAIEIEPTWPDGYFLLARIAYEAGRFSECIEWTKAGATKNPPVTGLIVDPRDYHYWPYYYLGLAYLQLGAFEEGIANLLRAIEHTPDPEAVAMLRTVVDEKGRQDAAHEFLALFERLARNDEWLKARELFRLAPKSVEQHPAIREWWLKVQQMTAHVDDPEVMVDFYRDNPGWHPYPDELIERDGEGTGIAPRIAFARKALCAPPKYVLDIGSADGFISLPLARDGYHVTGFDLDPRCVELANQRATKWTLPARYSTGSIDDALSGDATYDAVIAFEIIEHLVDPGAFLDKLGMAANKVILTTPHLSWENGHYKDWDKVELKGHIRIFDLSDMEILMGQRGRIVDLYREPFGPSGWIFASYYPKQYTRGSVTFVAPGTLESWSPRKLKEQGLGGSETALIRLAEEFAAKQMSVSVYGRIDQPGYYNGVRYRQSEQFIPEVRQDMVVAWRLPELADAPPDPSTRLVLWMHDTDAGTRLTPERAARFDQIVVLTQWHAKHMLKVYPWLEEMADKLVVIGNGVDPARFDTTEPVKRERFRAVYTSSPDRGLDVVLEHIWPKVVERIPQAELHVYYGWNNWTAAEPRFPHMREFRARIGDLLTQTRNVVFHGRVPQDELARELQRANLWLYPTYFSETFCISAVEAQLAGAIPVTNDLAALAETVKAGLVMPADSTEWDSYVEAVCSLMEDEVYMMEIRNDVLANAPRQSWEDVADRWLDLVMGDAAPNVSPATRATTANGTVLSVVSSSEPLLVSATSGTPVPDLGA